MLKYSAMGMTLEEETALEMERMRSQGVRMYDTLFTEGEKWVVATPLDHQVVKVRHKRLKPNRQGFMEDPSGFPVLYDDCWVQLLDNETGEFFYYNAATG